MLVEIKCKNCGNKTMAEKGIIPKGWWRYVIKKMHTIDIIVWYCDKQKSCMIWRER